MTLTELRYVVAAARHRHFGRAAAACFVSQPTLSVGIRKLEEELGVRLFERNRNEVLITPVGESIVAEAETVLRLADGIVDTAAAARDPLGGRLTLGVIYTIGPWLIPRLITALKELAPELGLILKESFTDDLAAQLRRGEIDCAVMSLPYHDSQLMTRALYEEPFRVALPARHTLAKKKRVKAAQLSSETLLLLGARNCFRDQVVEICPACLEPGARGADRIQQTLEGSSLDTICQMVATGVGVTVLPASFRLSTDLARHVVTRPFAAPEPSRTVALFYRRGFARPQLVDCLARAVRATALEGVRYCD